MESVMQTNYDEQTFERIKPNRKLNKLNAVEYEDSKRKMKSKDRNRQEMRKIRRTEVEE